MDTSTVGWSVDTGSVSGLWTPVQWGGVNTSTVGCCGH